MGQTSIPCSKAMRDRLRDEKPQGVSWDKFLDDLLEGGPTETVPVDEALARLRESGGGSATDIDPDELASKVASRIDYAALGREAGDYVVGELEGRQR